MSWEGSPVSEGGQVSGSRALGLPCPALPLLVLPPHLGLQVAVEGHRS